jgi:predicted nucleic acid-binding protein
MVADIKALCYIIALQYQWDLEFCSCDASYTELIYNTSKRAKKTREAWEIAGEGNLIRKPRGLPLNEQKPFDVPELDELSFIRDADDKFIIRDSVNQQADVLLTTDKHILIHKNQLAQMGVRVRRPSEWINEFLPKELRGEEDGVQWVERILFTIG